MLFIICVHIIEVESIELTNINFFTVWTGNRIGKGTQVHDPIRLLIL